MYGYRGTVMDKYFFIVEDGGTLATILTTHLVMMLPPGYKIVSVDNCEDVKSNLGDIILCDQNGVNLAALKANGATVITMSGDSNLDVDLHKPFSYKDLKNIINKKTSIFSFNPDLKAA